MDSRGNVLIIIVVGILILAIAGGGYYVYSQQIQEANYQNTTPNSLNVPTAITPQASISLSPFPSSSSSAQPINIPGWTLYTDKIFNISFQYPQGWKLITQAAKWNGEPSEILVIEKDASGFPYLGVTQPSPNFGTTFESILSKAVGSGVKFSSISISGHIGLEAKQSLTNNTGQNNFVYLVFATNKGVNILLTLHSVTKTSSDNNYYSTFDQFVSTIKDLN